MATTTLTAEELLLLKARLAEAEESYHLLLTGRSARVVVDQNGERVEFTAANRASLYSYILELRSRLPVEAGALSCNTGPAAFYF